MKQIDDDDFGLSELDGFSLSLFAAGTVVSFMFLFCVFWVLWGFA